MGNSRWETAFSKLLPKRASHKKEQEKPVDPETRIGESTDGFYKYSQTLLEQEEAQRRENMKLERHKSDSSTNSFASAMMSPVERRISPYVVDSPDWEQPGAMTEDIRGDLGQDKITSVMSVFTKVYSVSKVVQVAFVNFGVELDDYPMGFVFHIKRTEEAVKSQSLVELKEIVENLYYAVYARLVVEMANVELCSSFTMAGRRVSAKDSIALPEPAHMYKIFLSCKELLDSSSVRAELNKHTVQVCQEGFICRVMNKMAQVGFSWDDVLDYRRHIMNEVANESSPFCKKWKRLYVVYRMPPAEILASLSEKYLAFMPKSPIDGEIPVSELPFINPDTVRPDVWEREIIQDHRQATLAKLEGKSIGDVRRENERPRLSDFAKKRKCVCSSCCTCAPDCTLDVERPCPCAPRMLRIVLASCRRGPGPQALGERCSGLAKAIFDGLAVITRDVTDLEMVGELAGLLQLLEEEVHKERNADNK